MKQNTIADERDDEIVPFIGIPRKWTNPVVKIYAVVFLAYGGWVGYERLSDTTVPLLERFSGLWTHLAAAGFVEGLLLVSVVQIGDVLMYLTRNFMADVAKIRAEGVEEGRAEGLEQGKAEGVEEGRAVAHHQWQEWNARRMEAEAKGEPFNEPPPMPPENGAPTD